MNKGELVTSISETTDVSKADVERVLKAFEEVAQRIVAGGTDKLTLPGFLSIEQSSRAARTGRNPRTGAAIKIKAAKVPKFRPGKGLRDAL